MNWSSTLRYVSVSSVLPNLGVPNVLDFSAFSRLYKIDLTMNNEVKDEHLHALSNLHTVVLTKCKVTNVKCLGRVYRLVLRGCDRIESAEGLENVGVLDLRNTSLVNQNHESLLGLTGVRRIIVTPYNMQMASYYAYMSSDSETANKKSYLEELRRLHGVRLDIGID